MKHKRIATLALASMMGLTSLASGTTAFAASNEVAAPTNATGSVYISIEKSAAYKKDASTIDYILAPVKVDLSNVAEAMGTTDALTPDDGITDITILDVLKYAYGQSNFSCEYRDTYSSYYVKGIKDTGTKNYITNASEYLYGTAVANLDIKYTTTYTGIDSDDMLTEHEIITSVSTEDSRNKGGAGWTISQNNVGPYYGVSTKVAANDTLRMEWTSFNGMDIGYTGYFYDPDDTDNWGWTPINPFFDRVDKDDLVDKLAVINAEYTVDDMLEDQLTAYNNANAVLTDIDATSSAISTALTNLNSAF